MTKEIIYLLAIPLLFSCSNSKPKEDNKSDQLTPIIDSLKAINQKASDDEINPIWGYRFKIIGDFDADDLTDTLTEHFYSNRDHQETNKYYTGIDDVWIQYDSVYAKDCRSFFLSNNLKLDTTPIGGIFGPLWLKNEGNIDRDAGDELSYVESLPQQSSMNHCIIISFKKGKWIELYRFSVREWQFPPLPQAGKTYGSFGMNGTYIVGDDDTTNAKFQKQLDAFPGLISKTKSGNIKIQTFTEYAEDTVLVLDLSKHPKPYN